VRLFIAPTGTVGAIPEYVLPNMRSKRRRSDDDDDEKAMERAQNALKEAKDSKIDPAEIERLESVVRFSVAQLGLVKRRR